MTDALEEVIAGRIRRGDDFPKASSPPEGVDVEVIRVPPIMAVKAALAVAIRESGMSQSAFARHLGVDEKEVRRLLDPRHPSKLQRLQKALSYCGRDVELRVVRSARPEEAKTRPGSYRDLGGVAGGVVSEPAVADQKAAVAGHGQTLVAVPAELVPVVRALIAKHLEVKDTGTT